MTCWQRSRFAVVALFFQALFLILFGIFGVYYDKYDEDGVQSRWFYPMFQNVHVMIFIGFGFLMTFLKRYGFSAVGVNFLIAALVVQWHLLVKGFMHLNADGKIEIGIVNLILADFTAAAVLISFGAVIGKTSPLQLMIMAFVEVIVFSINEYIAVEYFAVSDIGGSMVVHVFGAYFGLAVSRIIYQQEHEESSNEGSNYHSDIFAMIGTVFLWLYWPSFNSGVAGTQEQQARAVINTYLSLTSCVIVTFAISSLTDKRARFNMVHIQNATLAGGVAVGTAANFMIQPWGAVLIGSLAAIVSVIGYSYIQPLLLSKLRVHDSCGVNNLHGMPGLLAAVIGAIAVLFADVEHYGKELGEVFPDLVGNGTEPAPRTASDQAAFQAATLGVTLLMSLVGGFVTGLLLKFVPGLGAPEPRYLYSDDKTFEVPDDFYAGYTQTAHSDSEHAENGQTSKKPNPDTKI